jgi:uncharacterized MAPEG superfamily protein
MGFVHIIALLAIVQFIAFGMLVAQARVRYGIKAPATTGHEQFERMNRVHINTLELLVCLLPALFIAAAYWRDEYVAALGAVYLVGRLVYWRAYMADPAGRSLGYGLSMLPVAVLMVGGFVGAFTAAAG